MQNYCWGLNSGGARRKRGSELHGQERKEDEEEDEEDEFVDFKVAKGGLHSSFDINYYYCLMKSMKAGIWELCSPNSKRPTRNVEKSS
jgi:hypothetical protein